MFLDAISCKGQVPKASHLILFMEEMHIAYTYVLPIASLARMSESACMKYPGSLLRISLMTPRVLASSSSWVILMTNYYIRNGPLISCSTYSSTSGWLCTSGVARRMPIAIRHPIFKAVMPEIEIHEYSYEYICMCK